MFSNKKKQQQKYIDEFNKYINNDNKEKEYADISKFYKTVYDYYKEKLKDSNFDIKIERIQLEKKSGKYNGFVSNNDISFLLGLVCSIIPFLLQYAGVFNTNYNFVFSILTIGVFYLFCFKPIAQNIKQDRRTEEMVNMAIIVLGEIEKEQQGMEVVKSMGSNAAQEAAVSREKSVKGSKNKGKKR